MESVNKNREEQPKKSIAQNIVDVCAIRCAYCLNHNHSNHRKRWFRPRPWNDRVILFYFLPFSAPFWLLRKRFGERGHDTEKPEKHVYRKAQNILDHMYMHVIYAITFAIIIGSLYITLILWIKRGGGMFLKLCPTTIACTAKPYRVESNPDITGVGVRAATYMQSLSAVIILGFGSSDFSSTRITLSISSLALVTSCLVMMIRGQLSLPDATVAAKLFDLTVTPFFIVEPWHSRTPGLFVANSLRSLVFVTINLWLNLQSPCFGNKAQQNMCIERPGIILRGLKLFYYGLISAAWFRRMFYFIGTSNFLGAFYALISEKARHKWLEQSNERFEYAWCSALANKSFFAWWNDDTVTFSVFDWHKDRKDKFCFSQRVSLALRIARCQRAIIAIIYLIIFTILNEISVKKNLDQSAQEWGYGQISALILTGPAVFQLFKLVKGSFKEYDGKREPVEIDEICLHARIGVHFLYFPYKAFIKKPEILSQAVLKRFNYASDLKNRSRKIQCQDFENSSGELLAEISERDTSRQSSDECICLRNLSMIGSGQETGDTVSLESQHSEEETVVTATEN